MKLNAGKSYISVRNKLVAAFMLTILPIILLGAISAGKSAEAIKTLTAAATIQTMEQTNRYMDLLLWNIDRVCLQIVQNTAFENLSGSAGPYDSDSTVKELESMLQEEKRNSTFISNILIVTASGRVISTGGYSTGGMSLEVFKASNFYKKSERINGGIVWLGSHPELDQFSTAGDNQYALFAARLAKRKLSGEVEALILLDVRLDFLKNLLGNIKLGEGGEIHFISPDDRDISTFSGNGKSAQDSPGLIKMPFFKKLKNSTSLSGSDYVKYLNTNYLMTYSRLGTTGYILIGLLPDSTLNEAARSITAVTVMLVILAALAAAALGLFIALRMGRVIGRVTSSAGLAAKGDLTVEIPSDRKDEFGILAYSITKMISGMRQLIKDAASFTRRVVTSAEVVSDTSIHVSRVSNDIFQVVHQIAEGANSQCLDTEAATDRILELASKMKTVSDSTGKLERLSRQSLELAKNGSGSIKRLTAESNMTTDITGKLIGDIQMLSEHSKNIGKIVKAINSIADQTHLLALNAAVEAAHAGKAGTGFSVVAGEIRKLADLSVASTREADNMIKLVRDKISDTSQNAGLAENMLKAQNEALSDMIAAFDSVSAAMTVFNEEIADIRIKAADMERHKEDAIKAISEITAISRETAAATQELSAGVDDQNFRISQLVNYVNELGEASAHLSESLGRFQV